PPPSPYTTLFRSEVTEFEEVDRLRDDLLVLAGQPPLRIGEAAEADELSDRQARDVVVLLAQDRHDLRQVLRLRRGDIEAGDLDRALVEAEQPSDHGQQRRLAGPVGPDQRGDSPGRDLQVDGPDLDLVAVGFADLAQCDHRRPFLMMTMRNATPPTTSTMIETTPWA